MRFRAWSQGSALHPTIEPQAPLVFDLVDLWNGRSAGGCTVRLDKEPIIEYITSNIVMLKWMIANGYNDARTIRRAAGECLKRVDLSRRLRLLGVRAGALARLAACAAVRAGVDPNDVRRVALVVREALADVGLVGWPKTSAGH